MTTTTPHRSETWLPISSGEPYEVSDRGRVRSLKFGSRRILAGSVAANGYRCFTVSPRGTRAIHREVAKAFLGQPPFDGAVIRHLDGDRLNNAVENLAWGTRAENSKDMVTHGRSTRGERHHRAVLTEGQARGAKRRLLAGESPAEIAKDLPVTPSLLYQIAAGRAWAWIK